MILLCYDHTPTHAKIVHIHDNDSQGYLVLLGGTHDDSAAVLISDTPRQAQLRQCGAQLLCNGLQLVNLLQRLVYQRLLLQPLHAEQNLSNADSCNGCSVCSATILINVAYCCRLKATNMQSHVIILCTDYVEIMTGFIDLPCTPPEQVCCLQARCLWSTCQTGHRRRGGSMW